MAKSQVSPTLPIEFSEVCEVVYQDLLGTNGRTLSGCFATANASGKSYNSDYVGAKDRLSNFRGYPVIVPGDSAYFDADYAVIEYNFSSGMDLDTRTGLLSPTYSGYLGYGRMSNFSNILYWGGDNQGTGVETVLINIANYKAAYPTQNLVLDMRAWWWVTYSATPVVFTITLYKGGTPQQIGYAWTVANPTNALVLQTLQKEMKLLVKNSETDGTTVGVWEYNPTTYMTKVTPATDVTPPTVPTLSVQGTGDGSIILQWSGSTDADSPIKYCLWSTENANGVPISLARDQSISGAWNITSPYVVSVLNDIQRNFYIRAYDPTGNYSVASNIVTATATAYVPDTTPPSNVVTGNTSNYTTTSIQLNWGAATDESGMSGYNIYNEAYALWFNVGVVTTYTKTGLSPGTLYTFHIKGVDAWGNESTNFYTLGSVWTLCVAPTLTYVSSTSSSITISRNTVTGADSYSLYSKINGGSYALETSAMGTSYTKSGLSSSTIYLFYVVANNPAGYPSASSNVITQSTEAGADTTAPTFLSSPYLSSASQTSISIAWSVVDNIAVTGQTLYWRIDGGSYSPITLGAGQTYTKTGLVPGTGYQFYVVAVDAAGNSAQSAALSCSTSADTTRPSDVTGFTSGNIGQNDAALYWNAATDNVGVVAYEVYNASNAYIGETTILQMNIGGLSPSTSYTYRIKARDAAGNLSLNFASTTFSTLAPPADTTAPTFPTALYESSKTETTVSLAWASSDNVGVTAQTLYWRIGNGSYNTIALSAGATSYTKTGLTGSTTYSFYVRATDLAGNATNSGVVTSTTSAPPADVTPPSQVTGVFVGAPLDYTIRVTWDQATDNVGVYQYEIWESWDNSIWDIIGVVNAPSGLFENGGYPGGQFIYIKVRATDLAGNYGAFSSTEYIIVTGDFQ